MNLWPHQQRALDGIAAARQEGHRRILVAAPTGAGKSRIMESLLEQSGKIAMYTDRRMLFEQLSDGLDKAGIAHGKRASGHAHQKLPDVQLCMVQTEALAVTEHAVRDHHPADVVLLDEAHRLRGGQMRSLLGLHDEDGATVVGFTATPIGLEDMYDHIIVAATNSECRACGAHVPAYTYAPDEPDTSRWKRAANGDFEAKKLREIYARPVIFGRVYDHWKKLNGDGRPTILFGPDVKGSHWFAEQLYKQGVTAAHIDGDIVWVNGETYGTDTETRRQVVEAVKSGEVRVVCNRYVMREGIDIPELYHCVFATAFGSLQSYMQSGGRVLRAHPSIDHVIVQDHGGNVHRHGSLNEDRHWQLHDTEAGLREGRKSGLQDGKIPEPVTCPQCAKANVSAGRCKGCGYYFRNNERMVVQQDGSLRKVRGTRYKKPKQLSQNDKLMQAWGGALFAGARGNKTYRQVIAQFRYSHGAEPHQDWPGVPTGVERALRVDQKAASKAYGQIKELQNTTQGGLYAAG